MKKILFLIWIFSFSAGSNFAQPQTLFVKLAENNQVLKFDTITETSNSIYQSKKYSIQDLSVSPDNHYIALLEISKGIVEDREFSVLPNNTLTILNRSGKTSFSFDDNVRVYTWKPDGKEIAYVTGSYYEGGIGFIPENLYWVDLSSGNKQKINGISYPYQIYWSAKENVLYIKNLYDINGKRIFKFDFYTKELTPTDYYDIHFSPNEEYYIHFPDQIDPNFKLYQTISNEDITNQLDPDFGYPLKWIFLEGAYLLFEKKTTPTETSGNAPVQVIKNRRIKNLYYTIYNVKEKLVVKRIEEGMLSKWVGNNSILLMQINGEIHFEKLSGE